MSIFQQGGGIVRMLTDAEEVQEFKYLRTLMTEDGHCDTESIVIIIVISSEIAMGNGTRGRRRIYINVQKVDNVNSSNSWEG